MTYLEIKAGMTVYTSDEETGETLVAGTVAGLENGTVAYTDKNGNKQIEDGIVVRQFADRFDLKDGNGIRSIEARFPSADPGTVHVKLDSSRIVDMDPEMLFAEGSVVYMPGDLEPESCRVIRVDENDGTIWLERGDGSEYGASIDEISTRAADV